MNWPLHLYQARRWLLCAVLPALLVAAAAYVHTGSEPKVYQASATLYVQQPSSDTSLPGSTDIYSSQAVIPTYTQMIGSPVIARAVDHAMAHHYPGYDLGAHDLKVGGAGPGATQGTQLMTVTVVDTRPGRAAAAANTVATSFIAVVSQIERVRFLGGERAVQQQLNAAQANIQLVSQQLASSRSSGEGRNNLKAQLAAYQSIYRTLLASSQEFHVRRDTALNAVKVFSPALLPAGAIGPHPTQAALLFGFLALMIGVAGILAYDYFDDRPRQPREVEEVVGAPILGTVQRFDPARYGSALVTCADERSPLAEAYRIIRTNLQFSDVDQPPRCIVVTSALPTEGKSTTVSNLAQVFAEAGRLVALVDGDLRRPTLHRILAAEWTDGLTNLLTGSECRGKPGIQQTEEPNLLLVASGPPPPRPADLLGSERMGELVEHLQDVADLVLLDSPPVLAVTDAAILATISDGVILVVDPARSKRRDLYRAREAIEAVGGRILGVVVNRLSKRGSAYYYFVHRYHYGYQYRGDYTLDQPSPALP